MTKKFLTLYLVFVFITPAVFAQNIGINEDVSNPDASSILEVKSANKGVLIPRISLTGTFDVSTIASPATSLLVYNIASVSDVTPGYYYWDGTKWVRLLNVESDDWRLAGNAGTTPGTDFIFSRTSRPRRPRLRLAESALSAICCSSRSTK